MKRRSRIILIVSLVISLCAAALIISISFNKKSKIEFDDYQPIEEFAPAFQAISEEGASEKPSDFIYDIEETVRIMNGLEMAQSQSEDFYGFLEYMAKQDYSMVAQEVLDAKAMLLPILQEMFQLEKEYDDLKGIWILARSIGSGVGTLMQTNISITDVLSPVPVAMSQSVNEAKTAIFENYKQEKALKASLKKKLDGVKMAYLDYLTEYAPVYHKYMKEWDALCLNKDKAYLDAYSGRMIDSYDASAKILEDYPTNREALLLKSFSLINIGNDMITETTDDRILQLDREINLPDTVSRGWNKFYIEADLTLDKYIELYPGRSAPALVLKGLLNYGLGKEVQALSYFDMAAIEYPRQAEVLTDLLDSYRMRTYLNKTPEGQYLLRLYRSTMEGYGIFSPNFIKARHYADIGDMEKSKTEIYNHFFRRGNQGIYDCLLSDMQFCEDNLYSSFKQLLMERSFIDVKVSPSKGIGNQGKGVKVAIINRSDIDLENVRIFLCLHYTDMYTDEYDVIKVPAKNIIPHHQSVEMDKVKIEYEDKTYNDITRVRAIVMTDDRICWIDAPDYKRQHASDAYASMAKMALEGAGAIARTIYLNDFALNVDKLKKIIIDGISANLAKSESADNTWSKIKKSASSLIGAQNESNRFQIELPRILTMIDPVFSINQLQDKENVIFPEECYLAGSCIRMTFDYKPNDGDIIPLYIYSDFVNFKIDMLYKNNKSIIHKIEVL